MRRLTVMVASLLCLSAAPAQASVRTLILDPARSSISFVIGVLGLGHGSGQFRTISGVLTQDKDTGQGDAVAVDIRVDLVNTGSAQADHLVEGPALFDVAHFPTARFLSRRITLIGDHMAQIEGDLTLHGVTRPILLEAKLPGGAAADQVFTATTYVRRSAFGMDGYHPLLGDTVALTIQAVFTLAP